jgi:hypothetical protein
VAGLLALAWSATLPAGEGLETLEKIADPEFLLSEGLRHRDWTLVEYAAKRLEAAGRSGEELAAVVTEARSAAALQMLSPFQRGQLRAWELAARARVGDPEAREMLRAHMEAPAVTPAEYAHEKYAAYQEDNHLAAEALRCLLSMKDPGAEAFARQRMEEEPPARPEDADENARRAHWLLESRHAAMLHAAADAALGSGLASGLSAIRAIVGDRTLPLGNRVQVWAGALGSRRRAAFTAEQQQQFEAQLIAMLGEVDDRTPRAALAELLRATPMRTDNPGILASLRGLKAKIADPHRQKMIGHYVERLAAADGMRGPALDE